MKWHSWPWAALKGGTELVTEMATQVPQREEAVLSTATSALGNESLALP